MSEHSKMRDRRDVGQVVFLSEKMAAARELNTCCVGVEAALETDRGLSGLLKRLYGSKRGEDIDRT